MGDGDRVLTWWGVGSSWSDLDVHCDGYVRC